VTVRPLDALISAPEQRLMGTVLAHPDRDYGTLELLTTMGSSRSAGSTVLNRWVRAGLLLERRIGNQRRLAVNKNFLLYPELQRMALKTVGLTLPLARAMAPLASKISEAFVFGSVAAGTDTSLSDIDLAVVGDLDLFTLSPLLDVAERELGRPIHANVYSVVEWSSPDDPILRSIRTGPRLDLTGALREQTAGV
jgi:predicted nucleotidyltransferase